MAQPKQARDLPSMNLQHQQLAAALDAVVERVSMAERAFERFIHGDPYGEGNAPWHLEIAYAQLLTVAEAMDLPLLRADISRELEAARKDGLLKGEPMSSCFPATDIAVPRATDGRQTAWPRSRKLLGEIDPSLSNYNWRTNG
jgi:hypothetical protein